ncbi:MAG TPA: DUF456 family protein [Longimicrobiales bacterium]|nr:DUF456 family protein [Longimicrobiales bacterium]
MLLNLLGLAIMLAGLLVIPFGLPGLWLMIGVVAVGTFAGTVSWWLLVILVVLGVLAELLEFLAVKRFSDRHGGSTRAFWGAIAGGLAGAILLAPIAVVGPLIGGILGTFAGAALVTGWELRHMGSAMRVGMGAALGRAAAVAIKVGAAVIVLVIGGGALFF